MQALTAAISDFALTACKIVQKVNLFRNRDNLFSITSQQFPPKVYTTQLHSYAVTQLHKV